MITAGVLAALVMNTFVFPKHCRVNTEQIEATESPTHHVPLRCYSCEMRAVLLAY